MTKDVSQAVEDLVNQIDTYVFGIYDPIQQKTNTCDTSYARVGKYITDSINGPLLITGIETDEWIEAGNATGVLSLPDPYFVPGTKISANNEWTAVSNDLTQKTPLVWLLHDVRYQRFGRESVYEWESDLRIFFLDETDIVNYYTKDHIDNVVVPMSKLAEKFIQVVDNSPSYKTLEGYEIVNFTRFGTEQANGYFQNILDANLSGVELRIKLTKYKQNCKC
jgi:hypothetical protein